MSRVKRLVSILCALVMTLALVFALTACNQEDPDVAEPIAAPEEIAQDEAQAEPAPLTELVVEDLVVGEGPEVTTGDTVIIEWAGFYIDGMLFNSSAMADQPYIFTVGEGAVIEGWDEGVIGMQVGGERSLLVPSDMAFGEEGAHPMVEPNQDLRFEITLIEIE